MSVEQIRAEAAEGYDRDYHPQGVARHFSAIMGSGSLALRPAHRRADRGDPRASRQADAGLRRPPVARAIQGARLVLFDGMGHDLPRQLWDRVIDALTNNFAELRSRIAADLTATVGFRGEAHRVVPLPQEDCLAWPS